MGIGTTQSHENSYHLLYLLWMVCRVSIFHMLKTNFFHYPENLRQAKSRRVSEEKLTLFKIYFLMEEDQDLKFKYHPDIPFRNNIYSEFNHMS